MNHILIPSFNMKLSELLNSELDAT
jgi:hypothetical protein